MQTKSCGTSKREVEVPSGDFASTVAVIINIIIIPLNIIIYNHIRPTNCSIYRHGRRHHLCSTSCCCRRHRRLRPRQFSQVRSSQSRPAITPLFRSKTRNLMPRIGAWTQFISCKSIQTPAYRSLSKQFTPPPAPCAPLHPPHQRRRHRHRHPFKRSLLLPPPLQSSVQDYFPLSQHLCPALWRSNNPHR